MYNLSETLMLSKLKGALPRMCNGKYLRWLRANLDLNAYATLKSVALNHGTAPNCSEIGRKIGVSHITVGRWIRALEEAGLLRLLLPLPINSDRRLVKSPKVFLCNTGLLNRLLGISDLAHLLKAPQKEQIFSGYLVEEIATRARRTGQLSRFYYYGGFGGPHIYLLLDKSEDRAGIIFKFTTTLFKRDWLVLRFALQEKLIKRGYVLYAGMRCFFAARGILAVPAPDFIEGYNIWMKEKPSLYDLHQAASWFNRKHMEEWRRRREAGN